jgi:hypothetical protein
MPKPTKPTKPTNPYPLVHYHGRNDLDHTITLSVRGQRYEYFLTPTQCDTAEFLCKRLSARKALNFAKQRASRVVKT